MKTLSKHFVVAALALCQLPAVAGPLLDSYFPLSDGDQKTFAYNNGLLTQSVAADFEGQFSLSETYPGGSETLVLEEDGNDLYFTGVPGWVHVSFNPSVLLLDDSILQKGGTLKTSTTASQTGISYPATYTVTVAEAGTITVPGGTFTNCRSITATEVAHARGQTITASALTAYLAPGVGIIKTLVKPGQWAAFVNGTVNGVAVGSQDYSQMAVQVNGDGTITPNYNGQLLQLGHTYTVTAKANRGSVFAGWTDGQGESLGTTPSLTFTMQSGFVIQANFVPNPFTSVAGNYIGLFIPYQSNTLQNSGFVSLTITKNGALSGYLQTGATRHALSGQFDANGNFTNSINVPGLGLLTVGLNVQMPGGGSLGGTVTSENWVAQLTANQLVGKAIFTETGRYTVSFADSDNNPEGTAVMNFTPGGATTLLCTLADGTRFSASSTFSPMGGDAGWPFYASLYGGKGCFLGWMYLGPDDQVSGGFIWIKADGSVVEMAASGQIEH